MKNNLLPILRTFLLLTLCVGLLGNAKVILLNSNKGVNSALVASLSTVSQPSNTASLSHLTTSVYLEPSANQELLVDKKTSADKKLLANKKPSADKMRSINEEILAIEASFTNQEPLAIKEPSVLTSTKPATDKSVNATEEYLSKIIENESIDSTIQSLKNVVKGFSNESHNQSKISAFDNIELPNAKSGFDKNYASHNNDAFQNGLAMQAEKRLQANVTYDGRYMKMSYPMGDVPSHIGVCTDVIIRAFRGLGIDLQQRVHEDMKRNFRRYPNNWQLKRPDSNIDHRRVPNLMTYFKRNNMSVGISSNPLDYHPGDIVAWDMGNGLTHIGVVSTYVSEINSNPLIVHNIGVGPEMTDILFDFKIIGHYRSGRYKKLTLASLN